MSCRALIISLKSNNKKEKIHKNESRVDRLQLGHAIARQNHICRVCSCLFVVCFCRPLLLCVLDHFFFSCVLRYSLSSICVSVSLSFFRTSTCTKIAFRTLMSAATLLLRCFAGAGGREAR